METNSNEIKIGDYIEGIEEWGPEGCTSKHKMRIIVDSIHDFDGNKVYMGQADDSFHGARAGSISTEYGDVRIITDEKPFTNKWWHKNKETSVAWRRDWKAADIVRHFKGNKYIIIGLGVNTETEQEVVIYKRLDGTGNIWVRPRTMFESEVDKDKYPEATQKWRFELVEE